MTIEDDKLKAWAKSIIKPDLPDYDSKDHEMAKLRFIINAISEDLSDIWFDAAPGTEEPESEAYHKLHDTYHRLKNLLYLANGEDLNMPDGTEQSDIDRYAQSKRWEMWKGTHLNDHHIGDCTATPATCAKCQADQFYLYPTKYEGKHMGAKALSIFMNSVDE